MDGSSIAARKTATGSDIAKPDALFRIVYFGEALRAMTEHVSESLISGAPEPMIDMLDGAFDHMTLTRPDFSPEEFALYVMSQMLQLCEDGDDARRFQRGAADYIIASADKLPEAYSGIVADARRMADAPPMTPQRAALPPGDAARVAPGAAAPGAEPVLARAVADARSEGEGETPISAPAGAARGSRASARPDTDPGARRSAGPAPDRRTARLSALEPRPASRPDYAHRKRSFDPIRGLEKLIGVGFFVGIIVVLYLVGSGALDLSAMRIGQQ